MTDDPTIDRSENPGARGARLFPPPASGAGPCAGCSACCSPSSSCSSSPRGSGGTRSPPRGAPGSSSAISAPYVPGELTIGSQKGPITGPLDLRDVHFRNATIDARIQHLHLAWKAGRLRQRMLDIDQLHAEGIRVALKKSGDTTSNGKLVDLHLPVNIIVRDALIRDVEIAPRGAAPLPPRPHRAGRRQRARPGRPPRPQPGGGRPDLPAPGQRRPQPGRRLRRQSPGAGHLQGPEDAAVRGRRPVQRHPGEARDRRHPEPALRRPRTGERPHPDARAGDGPRRPGERLQRQGDQPGVAGGPDPPGEPDDQGAAQRLHLRGADPRRL